MNRFIIKEVNAYWYILDTELKTFVNKIGISDYEKALKRCVELNDGWN